MGVLGVADNLTISGNTFTANNMVNDPTNHAVYLGSSLRQVRNVSVTDNTFTANSAPNGTCIGGNFTAHGRFDGLLVQNNRITQAASTNGCWGISITPAYPSAEFFRNVVVRGNTIERLGVAIGAGSSPGILIENNVVKGTLLSGIAIPAIPPSTGDAIDSGAVVRNNVLCGTAGPGVMFGNPGLGTQTGNVVASLASCPR
jgi:hypothetical protein